MHPNGVTGHKQEHSAYGSYGPTYDSPQNSYNSPSQHNQPGQYDAAAANAPQIVDSKHRPIRRICGLAATTFFLILAIIVLIIAAAVGGGIGGTIAVKNAKDSCKAEAAANISSIAAQLSSATKTSSLSASTSAASSSASSSSSATASAIAVQTGTEPWGPVGTNIGASGCPGANTTIYSSTIGTSKFRIFCNRDQPGNDLLQIITTSMNLCMEACASWNDNTALNISCAGVAYVPTFINGDGSGGPVDCYLKGLADDLNPNPNYDVDFGVVV
jgi:hypothetical protein